MTIKLQESLNKIAKLREQAEAQEKAGQTPEVSVNSINLMEKTIRNLYSDYSAGKVSIKETLTTTDTVQLIPKIIEGKLREAAEPQYLGTNFLQKVNVDGANSAVYVLPVVGEVYAREVGELGRYGESNVDITTIEQTGIEIRIKKIGAKVTISEEAIADSSWDLLGINIRKLGRAMGRYKEEWIFNNFTSGGHCVFDNSKRVQNEQYGTTGRGESGAFNDTLSVEDMLDMCLTLMGNGFAATDLIMHPLVWVVFARNSMIGNGLTWGALGGGNVHPWGAVQGTSGFAGLASSGEGQKLIMTPDQVQNRLPVPLTINFSPFVKFDKINKKFDMYCIDRSEVGVIAQREELSNESWTDPERDLRNMKCKERYGIGLLNNGRAITVAKGLSVAATHPVPPTVTVNTISK